MAALGFEQIEYFENDGAQAFIFTHGDTQKTLWFTGHSLGGAMATIYARVAASDRYVEYIQRAIEDEESGRMEPVNKMPPTSG